MSDTFESWGRYPRVRQRAIAVHDRFAELPKLEDPILPRGNGRSYGDSCLNADGTLLQTLALDRFISFDDTRGVLRCEAGLLLDDILKFSVPKGWFLPVVPGTKFVTLGGAIANDVHGKNHHVTGSFGSHVLAFELLRHDGSRLLCDLTRNQDWFAATIGGLGLTGLITWAEIQLKPVSGPWLATETYKFGNLDEFFAYSMGPEGKHEYTVAWVDCVSRGKSLGRGLFTQAEHLGNPAERANLGKSRRSLSMPFTPPVSLVNRYSLRAFNWLYYHRQSRVPHREIRHYDPVFFPLDGIRNWNRMYGPRGFLQYQCVIPLSHAREGLREILDQIATSGTGSFLAVLKLFGDKPSPGMLSFPRPGATLALDFANAGTTTFSLLNRLDGVVDTCGGAVYPAKDARMSGPHFKRFFPAWERFSAYIDPHFSSSFWRRVME